jgi:hypothetical protein
MKLVHVYESHHERNAMNAARKEKAFQSWRVLYQQGVVEACYKDYVRDSKSIGDPRGLPYFKDVIAFGISKCESEDDVVFFTNDDSILHKQLPGALIMFCAIYEVCSAQRREFRQGYPSGEHSPEQLTAMSDSHMGRDLIAGTKRWWGKNLCHIPDFLLACSEFDLCLAALIRKQKGHRTTHQNLSERIQCCELNFGLVGHEAHQPQWSILGKDNIGNAHNHALFKRWAATYAPEMPVPI